MNGRVAARPRVWAFGGGKGGVGRSLLAAGVGWHLGRIGRHVLLVDADPCGSSLHTCLGLSRLTSGEAVDTGYPGLRLLSGAARPLGLPGISIFQKKRYLARLRELSVDVVILDLGAGPASHIVDVFCVADRSLLVVVPEPSAVEKTFEFIRRALSQRLRMRLPAEVAQRWGLHASSETDDPLALCARVERETPQYVETIRRALNGFRPWIVLNGVRGEPDIALGHQLVTSCVRHLEIAPVYGGFVHQDEAVQQASRQKRLFLMETPTSAATADVCRLAESLLRGEGLSAKTSTTGFMRGDHYQILGLTPSATVEQVERAFRYLMDLYGENALSTFAVVDAEEARQVRLRIKEAYETLRHPVRRLEYDTRHGLLASAVAPHEPSSACTDALKPSPAAARPRFSQKTLPEPLTGQALRAFRESQGIKLVDIAENTKVALRYLEYIEQDRFKFLPAPVYLRGFLQEYARIVGLDPRRTADSYLAHMMGAPF